MIYTNCIILYVYTVKSNTDTRLNSREVSLKYTNVAFETDESVLFIESYVCPYRKVPLYTVCIYTYYYTLDSTPYVVGDIKKVPVA